MTKRSILVPVLCALGTLAVLAFVMTVPVSSPPPATPGASSAAADPPPSRAEAHRVGVAPSDLSSGPDGSVLCSNGTTGYWCTPASAPGNAIGLYSSRTACSSGAAGTVFIPTDGPIGYACNGTAWMPMVPGAGLVTGEVAPGNVSPFIQYYGTGSGFGNNATQTAQGGALALATTTAPSASVYNFQLFDQAYTPGHVITVWFDAWMWTYSRVGLYLANGMPTASDGGTNAMQMITFGFVNNTEFENADFIWSGTAWSTGSFSPGTVTSALRVPGPVGLRIVESAGPNYTFEYSLDNVQWNIVNGPFSVAAYIGAPGHCGFFIDAESNGAHPAAKLLAWTNQ